MDKSRIEGVADQAIGKVKSVVGSIIGDNKMKAEGEAQNASGKVENAVGGAKDAAREALD